MNLHNIVRGAVGAVNPDIEITILHSTGYVTSVAGKQVPQYDVIPNQRAQVQATSGKDIERMGNVGIQGVLRTVYLYGNVAGIVRADGTGGDILKFPQAPGAAVQDWKVVNVKETFADWCCVIVALQSTIVTP